MEVGSIEVACRFDENCYLLKIYNDCYGGGIPQLNEEAKTYFNSMSGSKAERLILTLKKYGPDAVKTRMGKKLTSFGLCLCPKECENFYKISEYDGLEKPYIDHNEYLKHLISEHLTNNLTMDRLEYESLIKKSQQVTLEFIDLSEVPFN
jgi:hypothetical protein